MGHCFLIATCLRFTVRWWRGLCEPRCEIDRCWYSYSREIRLISEVFRRKIKVKPLRRWAAINHLTVAWHWHSTWTYPRSVIILNRRIWNRIRRLKEVYPQAIRRRLRCDRIAGLQETDKWWKISSQCDWLLRCVSPVLRSGLISLYQRSALTL